MCSNQSESHNYYWFDQIIPSHFNGQAVMMAMKNETSASWITGRSTSLTNDSVTSQDFYQTTSSHKYGDDMYKAL